MSAMMALLAAMALAPMVAGQVLTPKEYRTCNVPPSSNDTVDVYTSALLERLIDVDDRKYEFTALLFLYFSWEDPTAMDKMITSTNAYRNGSGDCHFPCVAGSMPSRTAKGYAPEFSCCDDIWLPQVVAYNLIPPYHTQFSGLIVGEDGKVGWYKSLYGKYFTNMQFSLFPLDTQLPEEPMPVAGDKDTDRSPSNPFRDPDFRHHGVNIYISIKRLSEYYIVNQIVPIYVLVLVSLVTYTHNPSKVETRVALNLTCFLALTAIKWVVNRELPNSSYPTTVSMIIMTAYSTFGFGVVESIVVFGFYKKAEKDEQEEKEKQEAFASPPSSAKAETPSLTKSSQMSSFKAVLESSARSERWLTFSRGIRKLKGDHEHNLTDLAIIIDMSSLTLVVITTVVSSAIYFHT
ncbi:ligand-gated ion-channel protein [Chloropicon roscoffensis]|uniref:Ligand-gated ion-channel protein n=1 Tax=Chloropicon roscoffensis TaxID=1461544 RepID=A0AAX4P7B2_9CHLO